MHTCMTVLNHLLNVIKYRRIYNIREILINRTYFEIARYVTIVIQIIKLAYNIYRFMSMSF